MDRSINGLVNDFIDDNSENGDKTHIADLISIGIVVDNDDPLQQGRLRIFCPAYNDNPKKLLHLTWSAYVSPVGGVISQDNFARGHIPGTEFTTGPVHYGFWAIPEIGAHALVACINGDPRRRVWLGCLPSHQETHTIGNGRFKHTGGGVDGPQSSTGGPIEPASTKLKEAFNGEITASEWKTRGADYQITSVTEAPSPNKSVYIDDDLETIVENEEDEWVKEILGEGGYDWSGYKNLGSFLASRVFSWSTPGFHSISMDDRPFNSRIRIRTTGGSQIILDDTNERIYFSTSGGKSWIEMDAAGNIDMFAERRLSIHAEKDLNFTSGESIRLKADKYISMYAGTEDGQTPLNDLVPDGDIRIQSSNDMHVLVGGNLQANVGLDFAATFGSNLAVTTTTNLTFRGKVNISTDDDLGISTWGNINLEANDVTFTISGKGTSIDLLTLFLDDFVKTFNAHEHVNSGANLLLEASIPMPFPVIIVVAPDETELAPWTNRVPEHEPWPRVMMQDSDDTVNTVNDGPLNNVDWIEQYDNVGEEGRKPIGKIEGTEEIERERFWRR